MLQVAALGLDPHKHLGKSIRQLQPHLRQLRDRFGCNVCGEGGEYETLTLDCPAFTHGRIVLDSWEVRGRQGTAAERAEQQDPLPACFWAQHIGQLSEDVNACQNARQDPTSQLLEVGGR